MKKTYFAIKTLFFMTVFMFLSCQKDYFDDNANENNIYLKNGEDANYARGTISFDEFQAEVYQHEVFEYYASKFEEYYPEEYISHISKHRILKIENDSITTYTLSVITPDMDEGSFVNMLFKEEGGELLHGFIKYTPTENWKNLVLEKRNEFIDFEGDISFIDDSGEVIASVGNYPVNNVIFSSAPCNLSLEPIIRCTDPNNPNPAVCVCGNTETIGWIINITGDCSGGGGGSVPPDDPGDGPGDNYSGCVSPNIDIWCGMIVVPGTGGGDGSGGAPVTGAQLPTNPIEWILFNKLEGLLGAGNFYFDNTINPNSSISFLTFEEFEEFYNDNLNDIEFGMDQNVSDNQDGTQTTKFTVNKLVTELNIYIKQTLKNTTENYTVHSVNTSYTGAVFASSWYLTDYDYTVVNNKATVNIYGVLNFNLIIEGIGTIYSEAEHYRVEIDISTGQQISIIKVN